jgi:hypothetical protein
VRVFSLQTSPNYQSMPVGMTVNYTLQQLQLQQQLQSQQQQQLMGTQLTANLLQSVQMPQTTAAKTVSNAGTTQFSGNDC